MNISVRQRLIIMRHPGPASGTTSEPPSAAEASAKAGADSWVPLIKWQIANVHKLTI